MIKAINKIKQKRGILFSLAFLFIFISCVRKEIASLKYKNPDGTLVFESNNDLLAQYFQCSCMNYWVKRDSVIFKDNSVETLYNLSDDYLVTADRGKVLDSLAAQFVEENIKETKNTETYEGRVTPAFQCIQFSRSKYVKSVIDSLERIRLSEDCKKIL